MKIVVQSWIEPPIYFCYGKHITLGEGTYINFNLGILFIHGRLWKVGLHRNRLTQWQIALVHEKSCICAVLPGRRETMPDPALSSGIKCLISRMPDTKEEYCSISQNQIMRPPGHALCEKVYFKDRKKLNVSFLRSFFVLMNRLSAFLRYLQGK